MSWKDYIPKENRSAFKNAFIDLLTNVEFRFLMENAAFYGTHHHYDDVHRKKDEEACDDCLDDSDDRDTREFAQSFFKRLWENACENAVIEPIHKKKRNEEEELEQSEAEQKCL
jgi:hypothetical protein